MCNAQGCKIVIEEYMLRLKAFRLVNTNLIKQFIYAIERISPLKARNGCQGVRNDERNPDTQDKSCQANL